MRKHDQGSAAAEGARRVTGRGGFQPGVNARRSSACCGVRISSRCRGSWVSRRRGSRSGATSFGGGPGRLEKPRDRGGGRRPPSTAGSGAIGNVFLASDATEVAARPL